MGRGPASSVRVHTRASSDEGIEEQHSRGGSDEENTPSDLVDHRRSGESPCQVPDLEETVNEELVRLGGDADAVEDTVEVVRDDTVAGPLGEEREGNNDTHALEVATGLEEREPADLGSDLTVELDGGLDFLVLVLDERVLVVAVRVVVGEQLEGVGVAALADEPTGRLGREPDEDDLDDGGETLESGGDTP